MQLLYGTEHAVAMTRLKPPDTAAGTTLVLDGRHDHIKSLSRLVCEMLW
jgi:hypothetical protein